MILGLLSNQFLYAEEEKIDLKELVNHIESVSVSNLAPDAAFCPDPKDKSFINFSEEHFKDPPGFHGMLFFGTEDSFYISHLPMFHKPHDYQAIVEVKMPEADRGKYLSAVKSSGGIFTFAPQSNFVLPEVIVQKKPIQGTLYQGHFEREGSELFKTDLELVRVVFYKKISANEKKPNKKRFVLFGNEKEYFLAHEIFGRPNKDEIFSLQNPKLLKDEIKSDVKNEGIFFLEDVELESGIINFKTKLRKESLSFEEHYSETEDLK